MRAARAMPRLPTVPAAKVLETTSRLIFHEAVSPWLVSDWAQHDYGIDAIVEITRAQGTGNFDATGHRFAVQLKATEEDIGSRPQAPMRVRPTQIRYWLEGTEPVLLVLCHLPSRQLFWRWVDHSLVTELNLRDAAWIGRETVTVNVLTSQALDFQAKGKIATYVKEFIGSTRRPLAPGRYVELHTQLSLLAADLVRRAQDAGFQSVTKRLGDLEVSVRSSMYVVALTGPARAGKSTLLNALIGREVSPVGRLPTTAVSLLVMAGARDEAEVVLANDERVRGEPTAAFLEQFATQEKNPDNCKGVRMVAVRLVSDSLERGVAYADAPGLHDPSADIRTVTETALKAAHAVLYLLDVSPAKNGGFSLNRYDLEDLQRLRVMAERLFVVLNKADVLSNCERSEVATYAQRTLTKYGIWDALPIAPIFLSASAGWSWQQGGRVGTSPLAHLEDAVWTHLLHTNSTGIDRLRAAVTELQRSVDEFASLLATRQLSGTEAYRLRTALEACRATGKDLVAMCRRQNALDEEVVVRLLDAQRGALLCRLRQILDAVPVDQALPTSVQLEQEMQSHVFRMVNEVWIEVSKRFQAFASLVSREVETSLQQARLTTGSEEPTSFQLPQVPSLDVAADSFEEAWTGLFAGGLFGLIIGGPWAWALAVSGWLAGALLGRERRRKREVERVVERTGHVLDTVLTAVHRQMREKISTYLRTLEQRVTDRISVFTHDVEGQLEKHDVPLAPDEARRLAEHERAVREALAILHEAGNELTASQRPQPPRLPPGR